jgi:ABC-type transport system involved in multi-copper enzyme maturation permease subunit
MKALLQNPLLIKQLREEVRSRKIFFLVPIFIGLLSIAALIAVGESSGSSFNPITLASTSKTTMFVFVVIMTILLGLVSMVLGAASFTVEREKATLELLELTPLSSIELILGKFLHAFVLILLILVSSLPVLSTLFFMGGLNYVDILLTFLYLILFFAVVILASICISIIAGRTIISIILSLVIGFVVYTTIGIMSGSFYREPSLFGFAIISPWLATAQQIFSTTGLKLAGHVWPLWPFYTAIYVLLILLFLAWGCNALDSRKMERNSWARLVGLITVNAYTAIGFLCLHSYLTITIPEMENFYQSLLILVIVILPCFALGTLTDRDQIAFRKNPLMEAMHPKKILLNYPPTGLTFLLLLLMTSSMTATLCAGVAWKTGIGYFALIALWILPWFLIFTGMRLSHHRPRNLFVVYIFGTLLYVLIAFFQKSGKSVSTVFDFFLTTPMIFILFVVALLYLAMVRRGVAVALKREKA